MPEPLAVFTIATSFRVPGLGVMALPAAPLPVWLSSYVLHTALAITVLIADQPPQAITGTVEELVHDAEPPMRGLLLDFNPNGQLPIGSRLHACDTLTQLA